MSNAPDQKPDEANDQVEIPKQQPAFALLPWLAWLLSAVASPALLMFTAQIGGIIGMLIGATLVRGLLPLGMSFWLASEIARKRGWRYLDIKFVGIVIVMTIAHRVIFRAAFLVVWVL